MRNKATIPGEAITERLCSRAIEESAAMQSYLSELTEYEKERFRQLAHHLVFIGFESGVGRLDPEQRQYLHDIEQRRTGASYIKGSIDGLSIVEEAQGSF